MPPDFQEKLTGERQAWAREAARWERHDARLRGQDRRVAKLARKAPITVGRIVDIALELIATDGYEALTMRRVAAVLGTGPASLYAHVVNKADLDDLLIGRLCTEIAMPTADPDTWREQILYVCGQIRDQYLRYPGISRAALAVVPTNAETLRISEGMLAILLAGGIPPQRAAWGIDALTLYVNAYCLELSLWVSQMHADGGWAVTHDELLRRFNELPAAAYPLTKRYADELTAGEGHDRFDFALGLLVDGLTR